MTGHGLSELPIDGFRQRDIDWVALCVTPHPAHHCMVFVSYLYLLLLIGLYCKGDVLEML